MLVRVPHARTCDLNIPSFFGYFYPVFSVNAESRMPGASGRTEMFLALGLQVQCPFTKRHLPVDMWSRLVIAVASMCMYANFARLLVNTCMYLTYTVCCSH